MGASLWRDRVFSRVWASHTVSQVGTAVGEFALPVLAAETLGASSAQVGLLLAARAVPLLVLGLVVGVIVDRRPRLPLMVIADLARLVLLGLIPLTWWLGVLTFEVLLVLVVLAGLSTVLFDVASQALVNAILPRSLLVAGNARMFTGYAAADVAGPSLAGVLLRVVPPPVAFALDAISYGLSAVALTGARSHERQSAPGDAGSPSPTGYSGRGRVSALLRELREGLAFVFGTPTLRTLTVGVALWNLGTSASQGMLLLFILRELRLDAFQAGLLGTAGGLGLLVATLRPDLLTRRFGLGRGIVAGLVLGLPAMALVALAGGPTWLVIAMLMVGTVGRELSSTLADVNQFALRNAVTPDRLRGRVASAARVVLRSTVPLGFLLGGLVADAFGLRTAMLVGLSGPLAFAVLLARSPIMSLRAIPPEPIEGRPT